MQVALVMQMSQMAAKMQMQKVLKTQIIQVTLHGACPFGINKHPSFKISEITFHSDPDAQFEL